MSVEPNIKNRVTGAIVLIALAVIFLPLILDGQKKNQILESQIPEKPIKGEIILVNVDEIDTKTEQKSDSLSDEKTIVTKQPEPENNIAAAEKKAPAKDSETETKKDAVVIEPKDTKEVVVSKPEVVIADPVEERRSRPNYKASAFVIQLGSFGNKTNASKLVTKLKKAGYKAYLSEGKSGGRTISRVLVGPMLKRQQAESKVAALNKLAGLKAIIVTYDPLRH